VVAPSSGVPASLEASDIPASTPPPVGSEPAGTLVLSVAVHPSAALDTANMSGLPAKSGPAVMVSTHRPPEAATVTFDWPFASSGASNTTCREAEFPGTL
jgi:hypothetical protein